MRARSRTTACRSASRRTCSPISARGNAYRASEQLDRAEADYASVIRIAPTDARGWRNRGLIRLFKGNNKSARRRLRQGAAIRSGRRVLLEQPRAGQDARRRQEGRHRGFAQGAGAAPRARKPRARRSNSSARRPDVSRGVGYLPHPGGGPWRSIASTISRCLRSSRFMCTATTPWIDGTRNSTGKNPAEDEAEHDQQRR